MSGRADKKARQLAKALVKEEQRAYTRVNQLKFRKRAEIAFRILTGSGEFKKDCVECLK